MVYRLDVWLIARCEQISHTTQRWFGWTSLDLERLCLMGCVAYWTALMLTDEHWGMSLFMAVLYLASFAATFTSDYKPPPRPGCSATSNIKKLTQRKVRIFCLLWIIPMVCAEVVPHGDSNHIGSMWWWFLVVLSTYFECCDDLPPATSKMRKLVSSIKAALTPSRQPVPVRG